MAKAINISAVKYRFLLIHHFTHIFLLLAPVPSPPPLSSAPYPSFLPLSSAPIHFLHFPCKALTNQQPLGRRQPMSSGNECLLLLLLLFPTNTQPPTAAAGADLHWCSAEAPVGWLAAVLSLLFALPFPIYIYSQMSAVGCCFLLSLFPASNCSSSNSRPPIMQHFPYGPWPFIELPSPSPTDPMLAGRSPLTFLSFPHRQLLSLLCLFVAVVYLQRFRRPTIGRFFLLLLLLLNGLICVGVKDYARAWVHPHPFLRLLHIGNFYVEDLTFTYHSLVIQHTRTQHHFHSFFLIFCNLHLSRARQFFLLPLNLRSFSKTSRKSFQTNKQTNKQQFLSSFNSFICRLQQTTAQPPTTTTTHSFAMAAAVPPNQQAQIKQVGLNK